ncbi:MAG: glycosidase [Chloroflexota bacterium]|nr:glycosidase [Chloroflexota bacterium]
MQPDGDPAATAHILQDRQRCSAGAPFVPLVRRDFRVRRLGTIMAPRDGDERESLGVLNPAAARSRDGDLYLFPRLVAPRNYSRIGMARVTFDGRGNPSGVERLKPALEPTASYELNPSTGGGCEDARVTFIPALDQYVMSYTALSATGPLIALAVSQDLHCWKRLGPVRFHGPAGAALNRLNNKDGMFFPAPVISPSGRISLAFMHRPMSPLGKHTVAEDIWLSYCPLDRVDAGLSHLLDLEEHHLLLRPRQRWEMVKLGGGAPPILTSRGWLMIYHGVGLRRQSGGRSLRYCAGLAILDRRHPWRVLDRLSTALIEPEQPAEREGTVANVVFPTAIDQRTDLSRPERLEIYYGMADYRIGVATVRVPWLARDTRAEEQAA